MITRVFRILTLFILAGLPGTFHLSQASALTLDFFRRHPVVREDTALMNSYVRDGYIRLRNLEMISPRPDYKEKEINALKADIDTAEEICVDRNLDFPSSLHLLRALYFLFTGDFQSASQEADIALKKSKTNNEYLVMANTMAFLGHYNYRTGFFMQSITYYDNSIEIAAKHRLKGIIPRSYFGLYDVYGALKNKQELRSSLENMIRTAYAEKDTFDIERGTYHYGTYLIEKEREYRNADSLLKICLDISLVKKDTFFTAVSLANMGYNYYLEKQYDNAIKSYNRSLSYTVPSHYYSTTANSLGNLGTIYRDLGEPEKALEYYSSSIENSKVVEDVYNLYWVYLDMSELYLRQRDTSNAYKAYVQYHKYNDAYNSKANSQGLSDARIRYEADSHNKAVELLSLRLYNQRLLIYGSLGLLVLSAVVLILLLNRAKIKAKRNLSELQRKIAEVTQANLRQQMNPHFIFNTLNSIQYYMYQHDKLATNNYLTKFSSLMRKVLENSQHTSVPLREELDALNLYLQLEKIRFKDKFEYEINVDEEIDQLLYKIPTMLIQPYVENSICHGLVPGTSKGFVKIDLKLNSRFILCSIEDNGIGREAASERKRNSNSGRNSLGTKIIASRLDLVNALYGTSLKTIYTDLKNENGEASGTRVEIQIPLLS